MFMIESQERMGSPGRRVSCANSGRGQASAGRPFSQYQAVTAHAERVLKACRVCEAECAQVLLQSPVLEVSSAPYPPDMVMVLACADACRVVRTAMVSKLVDIGEICAWCADLCRQCISACDRRGCAWGALGAACAQCEAYLLDAAAATELTAKSPVLEAA